MCPLCHTPGAREIEHQSLLDVWDWYREQFGLEFPQELVKDHFDGHSDLVLFECDVCLVQFFVPAVAGDPRYYDILSQRVDYEDRWEFSRVIDRLSGRERVLDVGCGSGTFLRRARALGCSVVGIDHNPQALASLEAANIEHFASVQAFLAADPAPVHVLTAFQLLEHVADPLTLASSLGRIPLSAAEVYVAVPNRDRAGKQPTEPLDFPPHHLTRWNLEALEYWGRTWGYELREAQFEPPDPYTARKWVERTVRNRWGDLVGAAVGLPLGILISRRGVYDLLKRGRFLQSLGLRGHTILARFAPEVGRMTFPSGS